MSREVFRSCRDPGVFFHLRKGFDPFLVWRNGGALQLCLLVYGSIIPLYIIILLYSTCISAMNTFVNLLLERHSGASPRSPSGDLVKFFSRDTDGHRNEVTVDHCRWSLGGSTSGYLFITSQTYPNVMVFLCLYSTNAMICHDFIINQSSCV